MERGSDRPRRLAPDARRAQLLEAARRCLAEEGLAGFTLEAVAREAGVTGQLLRHYFGSGDGLLTALATALMEDAIGMWLTPPSGEQDLAERFGAYLDFIAANPWGHAIWMHAGEHHPEVGRVVTPLRRRLAAAGGDWDALPRTEQLAAMGWVSFVEGVVQEWIAGGLADRDAALAVLMDGAQRFAAVEAA
jgi:AcrR family transcriptional regulator